MVDLSISNSTDEITTELLKNLLLQISRSVFIWKSTANQLRLAIEEASLTIHEIKYSGVELPPARQSQLDRISETMRECLELCHKVVSTRWNPYKYLRYARKMEDLEKKINRFVAITIRAHIWAESHHTRVDVSRVRDQLHRTSDRLAVTSVV